MFNNKQNHFSNTALTSLLTTILLLSANAVMSAESTQRDILLALYNDTNGSAWTNNTDWLGAEGTECSWFGVQCDGESNVTRLDLHQNNLVGSIPTAIGSLTTLEYLDFGGNQISGTVPDSIAQLTNLDGIYLWGNQFSGSLPSFFGGMTQLSHFSLGANQFSGEIPESYGNLVNMLDLDLAHNQLTGNIPSTLSNLSIANRIDLNNNQLSGTVPAQVIALGTVNLWGNSNLTGIEFGDPAACAVQTALTVGAQVGGALVPFEDCYINDEDGPLMADFYRLDLSAASDTTLIKIDAHSDFYYPHVGVLDSDGTEGEDIVETQIEQNSLSFEVALAPGEYVLYIHGGSYQPQNVAATGAYTFSTQAIAELQSGCLRFGSTWANLGVKFDAALTETDCVTTINDTSILNESYMLSLQQNQSVQVVAQSEIASQFRIFNESGFVNGSPIGLPNIPYSVSFTAGQSGRYRVVMYNTLNNSLETGAYNLEIGTVPESNVDQRTALIALYNATAGDNWTNNTNWLGAEGTECSWFGVQCDFGGNVSNLTLRENNLIGSLPSELASLSALQNLDLGGNQLSGTIPSNITQLLNLKFIYLWGNQYTGSLPLLFGEMPQLQRLSFGGNQFSGTIPSTYGNLVNIIDLDLAYNQLSGTIPSELGNLVNATSINLRQNQLSGAVPAPVLALGTVNLWANPNLTGIAFGDPAACDNQTALTLGAQAQGELTPFEDCYFDDERIMADFYRLDLSGESGTTLFKIDAYSDHYYPHIGVLDANGNDGQDIVDTQIQQNGLSFEVALTPGEYVLYIHGGSYQPQNVAATGVYTLSTTVINQSQIDCVAPTWVAKGVALDAALSSDDCLDTYNDPDRLYDSYKIWLEQGESVIVALTAEFESQILHFNGNDFFTSTPSTPASQQQVLTFTATGSGWHRYAVYASNNNPLAEGNYNIQFVEPPVFGDAQACTEGLSTIALGGSTSGATLDRNTDCYMAGRMSDRYALSLDSDTLFRATMDADGFTPLLSIYNAGAAEPITLNGNSQSNFTAEFYLAAGEYWLAASSGASNGLAPIEGSYELSLTASLPISQLQDSCMVTTTVFAGASLAGEVNTNDCRNGFVADVEARQYFDGYEFTVGAGEIMYPELTVDFSVSLSHWFNGAFQKQYFVDAGEDVRITINTAGTHELYVMGRSVSDLGSYQLDLFQTQPDLDTIPIAFSFAFTDFRNVVDGVVQTGSSDHVLTGIVDAVMADDDVFEVISLREAALDGNAYVLGDEPGIVALRANQPALLSLSGNLLDVLVCPGGFGATNDCPFGEDGGFLISEFWSPVAQGGALAGHPALGAAYRDRSIPLNKASWSANLVTESASQRDTLVDLYNSTGGDNWTNKTNWLGAEGTECSWYGVQCDGNENVTQLSLERNNLVGSIPEEIGDLSTLQLLLMGGNQLSGTIPSSIAQLDNLTNLQLWNNQYNGALPSFISEMTQLQYLGLGGNQFSGTIPASYGNLINMRDLQLSYTQLSGSIPEELANLVNATTINLSNNQLSGAVPDSVLSLGVVNLWANPNLTGIEFGNPVACENQAALALGAQIEGALTPFEDCYIEEERIMADFFRLDLSGESGTTLFKIEAYSDFYYPHVGVLDASGVEGQDIVDTQIQQNGLSFEVALVPGEYVLYIHGGSYQPRNVAATGAYTLSTSVIGQAQVDCVAPTWVNKGVELDAALSSDDCLDTYNDPDRLYDSYNIWLEEGESLITTLTADFESQILHFAGNDFVSSTPSTAAGQQQVLTYSAPYSGWHRYAVYASNNTPLAEGDYTIAFFEPPVFGSAQACTESLPTLALGGSTSAAALDRDTDCYIAGRMSDRYALSLDSDTLFRATMDADGFTPLLSIYNAGAAEPITLNGNSQSNFTAEFYLAAGEYWLAASSGASNGLAPIEGSYELSLTASLPISQLQDSCMVTTTVFAGASLAGEVNTNDCRNGFVADVEARQYFDGYEFTVGAGEIMYPELTVDFSVSLSHWFNGAFQKQYFVDAGEDVRITINTAGTHELYVMGRSVSDLGSYQLDLFQTQPDLDTIPIAFSFAFTDFRNVVDGVVQTGSSDHVLTGIVDAVMADDDVFEVISLREAALDGNAYVLGENPGIVAVRPNQPALLSLSGSLLDVLVCPGGFGATNDCPFGAEGGFLISDFWPTSGSTAGQGGALAGHPTLGVAYRDRSLPINKTGWSAYVVVDSEAQRENLISLYNATGGANWTNNTGWLGAEGTECSWFGVSCENGNVVSINLSSNGLVGTIPSTLSQFSELRNLILNNNQLSGSIPVELAQLSKLSYLSLATNQLTGAVPAQLSQLANLTRLFLHQNLLTGAIPSELGQLSSLTHLYLHQNELSGAIPTSLGQLSNLIQLFIHENQLTGSIPSSLGQLSKMTHLVLSFNSLSGEIPPELGQLSSLQKLFARDNQFTGAIPSELALLSNLTELYLADNQLSGSIPAQLTQLNKLTILDLENNNLTGALPAFAGSVAVNVDGNSLDVPPTQQVYFTGENRVFKGVFNNLPIFYNVTDGDSSLTGVGMHIYYDSNQVDSISFANVLGVSLLAQDASGTADTNDSDNDPSTDRFITIGWTDVSGNWPGSLPVKLFDLRVKLDDAMSANDQLVLNFVRSTNTTGYELELPQLSLAVSTETLDVDGNGKAEALTDGLLIIRRLFGFSGAVLIDRAIANDAVLTTAEAIVARLQQMESILDVDGDGKVEALTDGLLIIRYLFGFRGNVLVANAIGSGATRTTPSQIEEYLAALVP